jgi:hypothetical protein
VPKKLFRTPFELVQEWPEVFEDMYMSTMPVDYLQILRLSFRNGRIWEIDIAEQLVENANEVVADKILKIFSEYKDDIVKIDFSIDVEKLKSDIAEQTRKIL